MKTAVVILNWNTKDYLRRFLPILLDSLQGQDAEVIVADSRSTDGSMEMMAEDFPKIRRIELDANYGFTGGYNRALAEVDADYFVLMNSDIEVSGGWLAPLVEHMDGNPDCGACVPKLLSWYNRSMFEYAGAAGGLIDSWGYTFCRGRIMDRVEDDHGQYDSICDILWGSGACLMVRSSVWRRLGGFDDRFFAHMEEVDLCWRMQLEGFRVQAVPLSVVYHIGGGTLPPTSAWKLELNFRNNLLMLDNNLAKTFILEGKTPCAAQSKAASLIVWRRLLDLGSALVYLLRGKKDFAGAVISAHKGYRKLKKRPAGKELECYAGNHPRTAAVHGRVKGSILIGNI